MLQAEGLNVSSRVWSGATRPEIGANAFRSL